MNVIRYVQCLCALFSMRSLEIQMDGQDRAIAATNDMSLYFEMVASRRETSRELVAARAAYVATFRPGVRMTWRQA